MDIKPTVFSCPLSIVKLEPLNDHSYARSRTKDIEELRQTHRTQLNEFLNEPPLLNESRIVLSECHLEFNELIKQLDSKENELLSNTNAPKLHYTNQILQTENIELINENRRLKSELSTLKMKHRNLLNKMDHTRGLLLKTIVDLD